KTHVYGTLLRADWDDNPIDGAVFEKGEMILEFTNPASATANPATDGNDRRKMNASLRKDLFATELAAGITTWTYAKADALARAGGFSLNEVFPVVYKGLRRVGYASAVYGAIEAIIVVVDGGELTNEEMIILGAGVIVGAAAALTTGWIAVGFGAVSLG